MRNPIRKQTKATKVLENLRSDIANGTLLSGERLQMDDLKRRYCVGYSPLREALFSLVTSGLVEVEEQCGFSVASVSLNEFYDLYNVRVHIESISLELSMKHGDESWEADIMASWHRYAKYIDPNTNNKIDPIKWGELHKELRFNLVKACQSPWLLKIRDILYDQAQRYRALCLNAHVQNQEIMSELYKANEELMFAVLSRQLKKALKLSQASWEMTVNLIAEALKEKEKVAAKKINTKMPR